MQALALYARVALTRGDAGAAEQALGRALVLAEPGGFVRTFLDLGPAIVPLLRRATTDAASGVWTGAYAGASAGAGRAGAVARGGRGALSEREAEVLAYLARRLPTRRSPASCTSPSRP